MSNFRSVFPIPFKFSDFFPSADQRHHPNDAHLSEEKGIRRCANGSPIASTSPLPSPPPGNSFIRPTFLPIAFSANASHFRRKIRGNPKMFSLLFAKVASSQDHFHFHPFLLQILPSLLVAPFFIYFLLIFASIDPLIFISSRGSFFFSISSRA